MLLRKLSPETKFKSVVHECCVEVQDLLQQRDILDDLIIWLWNNKENGIYISVESQNELKRVLKKENEYSK